MHYLANALDIIIISTAFCRGTVNYYFLRILSQPASHVHNDYTDNCSHAAVSRAPPRSAGLSVNLHNYSWVRNTHLACTALVGLICFVVILFCRTSYHADLLGTEDLARMRKRLYTCPGP